MKRSRLEVVAEVLVRRPWISIAVGCGLLIGVAFFFEDQSLVQFSSWLIYGMLTLSLALVWGQGGISTFGQNAQFGIGAYLYGIFAINVAPITHESLTALLLASAGAGLVAFLLGYFMFFGRLSGMYVAIIPLAFSLVLSTLLAGTAGPQFRVGNAFLGGYNGMTGIPPVTLGLPGLDPMPLSPQREYIFFAVLTVLVYGGVVWLMRRPFGSVIISIRENELRTELLGYDTRGYKLALFAVGGVLGGLAGACFAAWGLFINPVVFGLPQAALVVIWFLVGGQRSLIGGFVGAALVQGFSSFLGTGPGERETPLILGGVLILLVLVLPGGLAGIADRLLAGRQIRRPFALRWPSAAPALPEGVDFLAELLGDSPHPSMNQQQSLPQDSKVLLEAADMAKSFDGVRALDQVSLVFNSHGIHCLIGPNGAGKSTFFNLLIGRYHLTSGRTRLNGTDITGWPSHRRARLGIGIKLQVPSLYRGLRVWENVWLAAYASTRDRERALDRTKRILAQVGLLDRADELAGNLAHGHQQWLEIAVVLAAAPRVILLDEPSAGMTRYETLATVEMVRSLGHHACVIVVEHDMEFVRRLDAPVTVFHQGRILAQGLLKDLRRDPRVLDVYLGREVDAAAG